MCVLLLGRPTHTSVLIGLPLVVAGQALRLWASGYIVKLRELVTAGPFALCRNPLYVGTFLVSAGYFTMCNRLDVWIAGVVLFWVFHGGAVIHEERLLREKFGQEYVDYCRSTPRFLPRPRGLAGNGCFSWSQLANNNEYRGAVVALLMMALLFAKASNVLNLPVRL